MKGKKETSGFFLVAWPVGRIIHTPRMFSGHAPGLVHGLLTSALLNFPELSDKRVLLHIG
jgi:hypothetical protein